MCGLSGAFGKSLGNVIEEVQSSLDIIEHRGPDAKGIKAFEKCILGHVRLSILDLSEAANQPMEFSNTCLAYNGEVYNHKELRENVEHSFITTSDTETLQAGIIEKGVEFFDELSGMYAGAFYDEDKEKLILFRDPLGIKNLYYYIKDEAIYFSSEIKGLFKFSSIEKKINTDTLDSYLIYENFEQGKTFYQNIYNLLPGEIMEISCEDKLVISKKQISFKGSTVEGKDLKLEIVNSVKRHLLSDVPVGVYISGGIDSSMVATISAENKRDVEGFTGYFSVKDSHYDERYYTRLVAKKAGIKLHEIEITPQHFIDNFDDVVRVLDHPRMGMGAFSQYIVAKEASKHRKVLLAGHGGDELFAGYPMFKAFWINELLKKRKFLRAFEFLKLVKKKEWIWVCYFLFKKLVNRKIVFAPQINSTNNVDQIFSTDQLDASLDDLFKYYQGVYIPGLLEVEDKISMANSLETRVPLWSNELISISKKYTPEEKMPNGVLKGLLKTVAADFLPPEVLNAPKRGFPTPLRTWFKNELYNFCLERLSRNGALDQVMPKDKRLKLLNSHKNKWLPFSFDERRSHKIWMLLCLESTFRQYEVDFE